MSITVTTAPCCWGVDDVRNPNLPPWELVFDEVKAAGYGGMELGPYGYVPLDIDLVSSALSSRGLYIVAGTIFNDLVALQNRESLLQQTDEICSLITRLPRPPKSAEPALLRALSDRNGLGTRRARLPGADDLIVDADTAKQVGWRRTHWTMLSMPRDSGTESGGGS